MVKGKRFQNLSSILFSATEYTENHEFLETYSVRSVYSVGLEIPQQRNLGLTISFLVLRPEVMNEMVKWLNRRYAA